ncbi:MAG: TetR/AcrR family transcriptional regulator [Clostridiales bacterium]|nr:TetR/AcrR family transcriptional regulator [Clostridiales bacterium]
MARKAVLEGGKREELTQAALRLFLKNGYAGTSVRMILGEVNGEVGMFYHYFKSKSELFEAAMDLYFKQYAARFGAIANDTSLPLQQLLDQLFFLFANTAETYLSMNGGLHWTVELALRQKTLEGLEPCIAAILQRAIATGVLGQPEASVRELAAFLVHGTAGFVHRQPVQDATPEWFAVKKREVLRLIASLLHVNPELLGGMQA